MLEIASWVFFFFFTRYHFSIFKRCRSYVHTLILTLLCDCRTPATGKHEPTNQARWHLLIANNPFSKPEEGLSADQKHRQQRIVWHTPPTRHCQKTGWWCYIIMKQKHRMEEESFVHFTCRSISSTFHSFCVTLCMNSLGVALYSAIGKEVIVLLPFHYIYFRMRLVH